MLPAPFRARGHPHVCRFPPRSCGLSVATNTTPLSVSMAMNARLRLRRSSLAMKSANKLTIHILASVAEHEREAISERTKAALAAAKARGKRLGGPWLDEARRRSIAARSELADAFAANVRPIIKDIQASGVRSMRRTARALTARGIKTARGGDWSDVQVAAILRR